MKVLFQPNFKLKKWQKNLLLDYRRIYKLRHFASLRDIKRKSGEKELATLLDLGKGFDLVQTCIIILSNRTYFIETMGKYQAN